MTKIIVNTIRAQGQGTVDFKDIISANGSSQWLDSYGVVKASKNYIDSNTTIPLGTNAVSVGTLKVQATVTVQGEWRVI